MKTEIHYKGSEALMHKTSNFKNFVYPNKIWQPYTVIKGKYSE